MFSGAWPSSVSHHPNNPLNDFANEVSVLMFVLWYCHKRGREVRIEKETSELNLPIDGSSRIEELPDDPQLPPPEVHQPLFAEPAARTTEPRTAEPRTTEATQEPELVPVRR